MERQKFRKIKILGSGAFGETILVEVLDPKQRNEWGERVVLKKPHDKEKEFTLIQELITSATLNAALLGIKAENIVRYLGFSRFEDYYVMIMEFIEGEDLRKRIGGVNEGHQFEIKEAMDLVKQIARGLVIMHERHVFHRDIKPENILIDKQEVVKITDLGISKVISSKEQASSTVGTLYYMPKEIIESKGSYQSDIYSLGVTFYELVTGRLPFTGESIYEIIEKIRSGEFIAPEEINPKVDERLSKIILKAMNRDVEQRYQKAEIFLKALENYDQGIDEEDDAVNQEIATAMGFYENDQFAEAEKQYRKIVEMYPENPKGYLAFGEFYNKRYQHREAISVFKKGIQKLSGHALLHRDLALSLANSGKKSEAIEYMKKAIELGLEPGDEDFARNRLNSWKP